MSVIIWWHICACTAETHSGFREYAAQEWVWGDWSHLSGWGAETSWGREEAGPSQHLVSILRWEQAGFLLSSSVKLPVTHAHVCSVSVKVPKSGSRFRDGSGRISDLLVYPGHCWSRQRASEPKLYCHYLDFATQRSFKLRQAMCLLPFRFYCCWWKAKVRQFIFSLFCSLFWGRGCSFWSF